MEIINKDSNATNAKPADELSRTGPEPYSTTPD
jgi:hypothetical protein